MIIFVSVKLIVMVEITAVWSLFLSCMINYIAFNNFSLIVQVILIHIDIFFYHFDIIDTNIMNGIIYYYHFYYCCYSYYFYSQMMIFLYCYIYNLLDYLMILLCYINFINYYYYFNLLHYNLLV